MLVTLAILLIMVSLLYGFGSRSNQLRKKRLCQENLHTLFVSLEIYGRDFGAFPHVEKATSSDIPLSLLLPKYTSQTAPFICPGGRDKPLPEGEPFAGQRISYAYYMGRRVTDSAEVLVSDAQINTNPKIAGQPVFSTTGKPPGNNHHRFGGNFLFCDGRAEDSGASAPFSLVKTQGVVLLNPRKP